MVPSSPADNVTTRVAWIVPERMNGACKLVGAVHASKLGVSAPSYLDCPVKGISLICVGLTSLHFTAFI